MDLSSGGTVSPPAHCASGGQTQHLLLRPPGRFFPAQSLPLPLDTMQKPAMCIWTVVLKALRRWRWNRHSTRSWSRPTKWAPLCASGYVLSTLCDLSSWAFRALSPSVTHIFSDEKARRADNLLQSSHLVSPGTWTTTQRCRTPEHASLAHFLFLLPSSKPQPQCLSLIFRPLGSVQGCPTWPAPNIPTRRGYSTLLSHYYPR